MNRSRLLTILLAALLLVGAANLGAFAATGGPLLLGKGNTASKTTKLKNTGNKAALSLTSKPGQPPLQVSNSTKVTNLNADLVDGLDSAALKSKSYVYNLAATNVATPHVIFALTGLPAGKYVANFSVTGQSNASGGIQCYLATGSGGTLSTPVLSTGIAGGGGTFSLSGGGFIDTTTAPYRFTCTQFSGTSMTIPNQFDGTRAQLVMTSVTESQTTNVLGGGSNAP